MIAAIRVRFTPTPAMAVWNDAVFANWLNPAIPFSLANFWLKSSFGFADLTFQIFPPVVMDDPRLALSPSDRMINAKSRPALVNAAIAKITDSFHPDWSTIDGLLIWYAQPTDLFGGGSYQVPLPLPDGGFFDFLFGGPTQEYKNIPVALCDIASGFDQICQELGHAYGFDHPLDRAAEEYGDPYDSMASEKYGGIYSSMFKRPADARLPVGVDKDNGSDVELNIGPLISAAQLYYSQFGAPLKAAGMFVDVPPSYAAGASSFTLHALDDAIEKFPGQHLPIAAVIPPGPLDTSTYFLELRRIAGYDAGLHINDADPANPPHPPVAVVIHYYDATRKRIVYYDKLPLSDNRGDRDYHAFGGGGFTFRVTSIGADFRTVGITIGGADFWRNFGVNMDDVEKTVIATRQTDWIHAEVSPCFMFRPGDYKYYLRYETNRYTIIVSSFGYELPTYVWTVNGVALDPAKSSANVSASVETPGPTGKSIANAMVPLQYTVGGDRLTIGCQPEVGNFSLYLEVKAVESSPGVLKNLYEDKTQVTSLRFDNVTLFWDANYTKAQKACEDALNAVNEKHIPMRQFGRPKPEDPFRVREIEAVFDQIATVAIDTGLGVANAVVSELTRVGNIVKQQISRR